MTLSKKETDLFDDLRDIETDNFLLMEIRGRPIICADLSEEQDGSNIVPLYGRLSDSEAENLTAAIGEDADEEERPRRQARQPKRWGG